MVRDAHVGVGERVEGSPVLLVLQVARDVVEQEPERLHAERLHGSELAGERVEVALVRVAHGQAGRHAEHEIHPGRQRPVDQLVEPAQLTALVRGAPRPADERVVLRRVHERVEAARGHEPEQLQPLLVRPRVAVEPLDDAADGERGRRGRRHRGSSSADGLWRHWTRASPRVDRSGPQGSLAAMSQIRPATLQDLPGAYRVCLLTAAAGGDASASYRNPDLLGHVFVGPYVVHSPELARVVVDPEGVAGYVVGAADTRAFEAWAEGAWWPVLRAQYPALGDGTRDAEVIEMIQRPQPGRRRDRRRVSQPPPYQPARARPRTRAGTDAGRVARRGAPLGRIPRRPPRRRRVEPQRDRVLPAPRLRGARHD